MSRASFACICSNCKPCFSSFQSRCISSLLMENVFSEFGMSLTPSMEQSGDVEGYEYASLFGTIIPPPLAPDINESEPPARSIIDFSDYPKVTSEEARKALVEFTSGKFRYEIKAAEEMTIERIEHSTAIHYSLQSIGEMRQISWSFEPYFGQPIDSPANGAAPSPWDNPVSSPHPLVETEFAVEVPHTASIKRCHRCNAMGIMHCPTCLFPGQRYCSFCNGKGCSWCMEDSMTSYCSTCHGRGTIMCDTCYGSGHLKYYVQLICFWKNQSNDYVIENTLFHDDLVRSAEGQVVFDEDLPRVWPIDNSTNQILNDASASLLQHHREYSSNNLEKIIRQHHKVRIVPVAQVHYVWKNKSDYFFVYGFENKIFAPNYPKRYGCCIL